MRFTYGRGAREAPSFRKRTVAAGAALALSATGLVAISAANAAGDASLPGSNFEIEEDANLVLNGAALSIDWLTAAKTALPESTVQNDEPTGRNDNSYSGGTKEDTLCPSETTGSIPNNKSDLKQFRVYREAGTGGLPGFLNLAWSRVNEPSGTTLMDFEFNQSTTKCAQGPNVTRTSGDLLLEYYIDQGGKRANIFKRTWTGTEWGPAQNLSDPNPACAGASCAVGTINQSAIAAGDSGDGAQSQYTFGEASIDLRTIFEPGKCTSFGSAMLKSRASDAFTSQLKDFITPVPISLTNCGKVIIRKQTDPDKQAGSFDFVKAFSTDPTTTNTFSLSDDGVQTFSNVLFGSGLTVAETNLPSGFSLKSIDCSASTAVTPTISLADAKVTFEINSDSDVLDCTYTNEAKAKLTVKKVLDPATSTETFGFTTALTPNSFSLGHNATQVFSNLAPGAASVTETTKTGWDLVSVNCTPKTNSGSGATATVTLAAGDDVTCTFTNRQRAQIVIVKVDDTGAPLVGAGFTATATGQTDATCTTALVDHDNNAGTPDRAQCTLTNLVPNLEYTVSETTVPAGYQKAADQKVTPTPGQTVTLTFTDYRLFKVIAFVCQESDNTLYSGSADVNSQGTKATTSTVSEAVEALLEAGVTSAQIQAALCGLDAKFPGLTAGTYGGSVTIN